MRKDTEGKGKRQTWNMRNGAKKKNATERAPFYGKRTQVQCYFLPSLHFILFAITLMLRRV